MLYSLAPAWVDILLTLFTSSFWLPTVAAASNTSIFWLEQIKHQGVAAFNPDEQYTVFRNVKDFGAMGDGVHDDTDAINAAISTGNRCSQWDCQSSTTTAAVVYFPSGIYLISSALIDYYETQIIGNPNDLPVLKAATNFTTNVTGGALLEGSEGNWTANNIFYRQVRNLELDLRSLSPDTSISAINWPTAQATSLSNLVIRLSDSPGTNHLGISSLSGGGGFMSDIIVHGGSSALYMKAGNPTVRNLTVRNAATAINVPWVWGSLYSNVNIDNCSIGVDMSDIGQEGALTFIDSSISNTTVGFLMSYNSSPDSTSVDSSLVIENLQLETVSVAIRNMQDVVLEGAEQPIVVPAWGQGHMYVPTGPTQNQGLITPNMRPTSLTVGSKFYQRSKPQYSSLPVSSFQSVRDGGALGDGTSDDTAALQSTILDAVQQDTVIFFDAGTYKITDTLYIPASAKIVGESYAVIMAAGALFSNMSNPHVVVQVGKPGEVGAVEWSDMIVSTQGPMAGAILIEWNLAANETPSGMWDVHTRIGGFTGSELQLEQCPPTPSIVTPPATPNASCIAAFMAMHITQSGLGLYVENCWLWTADHDLDSANNDMVTVYSGRGLNVESQGPIWLVGLSVEHHTLYQYQFVGAKDVFIGFAQSETPYYQPNPNATLPFPFVGLLHDPDFSNTGQYAVNNADAWGLRVINTSNFLYYTGGHWSYFNNYSTSCNGYHSCQTQIVSLEGGLSNVNIYNLLTIGAESMVVMDGMTLARPEDNPGPFPAIINVLHIGGGDNVGWIHDGEWLGYADVDFGSIGATEFIARVSSGVAAGITGAIQVALESPAASPIGYFNVTNTGGWQSWETISTNISIVTGQHTVYLIFASSQSDDFVNINWFTFSSR
ncbi:carbohydrate-binding module family 6 protein [Oidiodendron maius Zn]|uniref:Carbohydrate-binding module family 6 protein n=1 Tax=Oidiodendron maius (strain Zn) TaxID=913774 RepID=A0A0C3CYJ8_OIDMZ|nr:carbohydrate-binding module family 6 protein [Oidiodendron maius Zn]